MSSDPTRRIRVVHHAPSVRAAVRAALTSSGLEVGEDDADVLLVGSAAPGRDPGRTLIDLRLGGDLRPALLVVDSASDLAGIDRRLGVDFVLWPCPPAELAGRLRVAGGERLDRWLRFGDRRVDRVTGRVEHDTGALSQLSPQGLRLLRYLSMFAGHAIHRDTLFEMVWASRPDAMSRAVDFAVVRLRGHLESTSDEPTWLQTVRNVGYRLRVQSVQARAAVSDATPFVGRDAESGAARAALDAGRPVVLTGPPGIGKTRLARVVVDEWQRATPTGRVVWCDMVGTHGTADLEARLGWAEAGEDEAGAAARARPVAVVLDGLLTPDDALIPAVERVVSGGARVIVTSRHPLAMPDEVEIGLAPLDAAERAALLRALIGPTIATAETQPSLARLAAVADGRPLAIEVEAARFAHAPADGLTAAIEARIAVLSLHDGPLTPAVVAAIWQATGPRLRDALRACAVFDGPFTFEMAADVMTTVHDPVDLLDVLSDRRLIVLDSNRAEQRFTLLPAVRDAVRNETMPYERADLERRFARAMHNRLDLLAGQLRRTGDRRWQAALEAERPSAERAALDDPELAANLTRFFPPSAPD